MSNVLEDYNDGYYHLGKDLEEYPDAWLYVIWSKRGPGKTYSGLWYSYYNHIPIIYMKRTIEDTELICSGTDDFDPSPYVPLNRDKHINVRAKPIKKGVGAFYDIDCDGNAEGLPVSYVLAMNGIKKFKGFDFSICDWILMDEFIPQIGEIVKHSEGEMLLDLYMTVARDRQKRGRKPLKLILFANAENISTPITNTLEIVDIMADLNASGQTHYYDQERGIMLHHITNEEFPLQEKEKSGIYAAMKHTAWGRKSFEGDFANNDFSNIQKLNLKNFKPICHIKYKTFDYYIYRRYDGMHYMCSAKQKCLFDYNLNRENDQKLFYYDQCIDLRNACMEDKMRFEKYTMYDLIINYKKIFTNI